jgi:DUF4097 and DUF4098 domain-containing protein YvlB
VRVAAPAATAVTSVAATTQNGTIEVRRGGDQVVVEADIRARSQARADAVTVNTITQANGSVQVSLDWPDGGRKDGEGASLVITLPQASSFDLRTSNGRIEIAGGFAAASALLETSNGSIIVSDFAGVVNANTSNGRVTLDLVGGANVDTSNGAINVVLRDDAAGPVTLDTSNGSISLSVGPSFVGSVSLDTSNGSLSVQAPKAQRVTLDRTDGTVDFGAGGKSVLDTSNGSITLKQR